MASTLPVALGSVALGSGTLGSGALGSGGAGDAVMPGVGDSTALATVIAIIGVASATHSATATVPALPRPLLEPVLPTRICHPWLI
jgi:hypothetical protein